MHIGFDISQTGAGKTGCGYYAYAMIQAMLGLAPEHRFSLYPSFGDFYFDPLQSLSNAFSGSHASIGPRHISREAASEFWNSNRLEPVLGHPNIIHSNNFWCPTQLSSSRLVYTLYDLGFMSEPWWTTEENRLGCFDGVFRSAVTADWIVAISKFSREHYLAMFPSFPENRIRVIYPCSRFSDASVQGEKPSVLEQIVPGQYWLTVGTVEPRKNQKHLTIAYARYLELGGTKMPLVIAGGKGWLMEGFEEYLKGLGIEKQVIIAGYVTDLELVWLYRNCFANIYPSLFEGFGLPVLEGMQFGAATVASNTSSIPEVVGDSAILLDPADLEVWVQTMLRLANSPDERMQLAKAAMSRASMFDWKVSALSLLDLYREAASLPKLNLT